MMSCAATTTPAIVELANDILAIDIALIATAVTVVTIVPALLDLRSTATEGYFSRGRRRRKIRRSGVMLAASIPLFAAAALAALITIAAESPVSGFVAAALTAVGAGLALVPSVLLALDLRGSGEAQDSTG